VLRALTLVALVVAALVDGSAVDARPATPCQGAPGFTCAVLTVPLDHAGRAKGQLRLAYAVQDGDAPRGVLVFLTGGPGQPGAPYVSRISSRLGPALDGYRLVMVDQRGTGAAGALQCPALQRQMGSTDLAVPTKGAVTSCAAAIGTKRRYFNTAQTVEDLETLREALGVAKLTLDGVSYGTFVAERYALAHPDRVARLVLDSVVRDDGVGLALELPNMHRVGVVLGAATARDLAKVVARRKNGPELLNALVTMSVADPTYPGVASALDAAAQGRDPELNALVARWQADHGTSAEALSQGLHASTLCAEIPMPWGGPGTTPAKRAPAVERAVARLTVKQVYPFDRATASGNGLVKTCVWWPPTPAPPRPAARAFPSVPVLLLAGDRDLSTPLPWAQYEAKRTDGKLVVVRGAGHSVQLRAVSEAGRDAVRAFLR
jgi:pimeloyl-ACP methyl ester carboxylesterase